MSAARIALPLPLLFGAVLGVLAAPAHPQSSEPARFACDDARTRGFSFYCDPSSPAEDAVEEAPAAPVVPSTPPAPTPPTPQTYTEQMMALRAAVEEAKHRAILEPTQANVIAYMDIQAEVVTRAQMFTETWQRALWANPRLDPHVAKPANAMGTNLFQDRRREERMAAFEAAATERALMFVMEGPERCPFCAAQSELIAGLAEQHGVAIFAVTKDGATTAEFPQASTDAGQLERFGLADTRTPFLALVEPRSGAVDLIGAGLLTQDVILARVRVITAVEVGQMYD